MTFDRVFNVDHARVADLHITFVNKVLHFALLTEMFVYYVDEISASVCFYCLIMWRIKSQYFLFSIFTSFGRCNKLKSLVNRLYESLKFFEIERSFIA